MYLFCVRGVCECRKWSTEDLWKREDNLKELVLSFCVWVLGLKLRSPGNKHFTN